MQTDTRTYHLVYSSQARIERGIKKKVIAPFRYRVWMGAGLEPVCLVTINNAKHIGPDTRFGIRNALLGSVLHAYKSVRYFEQVIQSERVIAEIYFPGERSVTASPCAELRSLAYLERILGLTVSVV